MNGDQQRYRILIQILVSCIEQARHGTLLYFDRAQQNIILGVVWFECFLLRAACWTIDVLPVVETCKDTSLAMSLSKIQGFQVDLTELCLLETLILCRKEFGTTPVAVKQLEAIHEGALLSMGRYILHKGYTRNRYGKLLTTLRSLGDPVENNKSRIYHLFKSLIGGLLAAY